ncbi:MAG: hypothetical protein KAS04_00870, partial [Candidatus Aenigmarchaeota archaeon]|nr:hypothetical protein [Candidatus Aenigmarchaeota archaeon]
GKDDEKTISDPENGEEKCKSHAENKCYGDHVYWFDSCGHKEDKKEYCQNGCELGFCKEKGEGCKAQHEVKCYSGHVYWYDSCGNKEYKKEYCNNGCEDGKCLQNETNQTCIDSDGGINLYEKGTATRGSQVLSDHCNSDGTLTEKYCADDGTIKWDSHNCPGEYYCYDAECVALNTTNCTIHHEYKCYSGHVYWYNSCGVKEEKKEYCEYGCEGTECIECASQHEYACHDGDIYWYNSCGFKEDKKEYCNNGCSEGECIENGTNDTWSYRRKITVTYMNGENIEEYPIIIENFDCEGHCNVDGSDIRVVDEDSGYTVDFGLLKTSDNIFDIVFKLNLEANNTEKNIYVHYGNEEAIPANKEWDKVRYNTYDEFEGSSVDSSIWSSNINPNGGSIVVSGGILKIISTTGTTNLGGSIISIQKFNLSKYNIFMETKVKSIFNTVSGNAHQYGLVKSHFSDTGIYMFKLHAGVPGCGDNLGNYDQFKLQVHDESSLCLDYEIITANFSDYQTHLFRFKKDSANVELVEDGDIIEVFADHDFEDLGAYFFVSNSDQQWTMKELWIDYVKLYKYLDSEPNYTVGEEELL